MESYLKKNSLNQSYKNPNFHLITFGSPRVGTDKFNKRLKKSCIYHRRFVYSGDSIPEFPLPIFGFHHPDAAVLIQTLGHKKYRFIVDSHEKTIKDIASLKKIGERYDKSTGFAAVVDNVRSLNNPFHHAMGNYLRLVRNHLGV